MKKCVIMRGVPGAGKSTEANRIRQEALEAGRTSVIHSTDNYFMVDGVYKFDPNKIGFNHQQNQAAARRSMANGVNVVVIDNTNTTAKEVYPYVEMAFNYDYDVEFVEPTSAWWMAVSNMLGSKAKEKWLRHNAKVFAARNTHNCSEDVIVKMLLRYQPNLTVEDVIAAGK